MTQTTPAYVLLNHSIHLKFLKIAAKSKEICRRYSVPILINDRIDIALAMGADGVHVGQSDMPLSVARELLPKGTIIGVSCNTPEEADVAVSEGADYIGIGPVWTTQTKADIKNVVGVRGVGEILDRLRGSNVKSVGIGRFAFIISTGAALMRSHQPV